MAYNDVIAVMVRIANSQNEFDVELPESATGKEIVDELIDGGAVARVDPQGNPYIYEIFCKDLARKVEMHQSLGEAGVKNGYILLITPKVIAG